MGERETPNHYELLGVPPTATPEEIRRAFRALAKTAHPDVGGDVEHFRLLRLAHDTLVSPITRRGYDKGLGTEWLRRPGAVRDGVGAWKGRQGTFTGDVEFPSYLRDVTDAPWEAGDGGESVGEHVYASAAGIADPAASAPPPPATVLWWWNGNASFDPILVGAAVLVASGYDVVLLDALAGSELWRTKLPSRVARPPVVVAGHVVVVDDSGSLTGLDVGGGTVLWRHVERSGLQGPVPSGRFVAVASEARVEALDPGTGRSVWSAKLISDVESLSSAGEVVMATTRRRSIEVIDARNGRHRWVQRPMPAPRLGPVWATGSLWLVASAGRLVSLDAATGKVVAPHAPGLAVVGLTGDEERAVVSVSGPPRIVALDHLGRVLWETRFPQIVPTPAVDEGVCHVLDAFGRVTSLDLASGEQVGAAMLAFEPAGAPVAGGGQLVVTDRSGTVWAHATSALA